MRYSWMQWLLFFFFYCLAGWIWESCYVSVRKKKWVNRGFLHGPWLPIYGFGAVIVLWLTLPVRENIWLTYLVGMVGATILEYVTGAAMEFLFHVRYWDYSNHPLNLNGHICVAVSLGWGVFSVLMVKVIHQPVAGLLLQIPDKLVLVLDIVLLLLFAVDIASSTKAALDLRRLLEKIEESSARVLELERKIQEAAKEAVAIPIKTADRQIQRIAEEKQRMAEEKQRIMEDYAARLQELKAYAAQKQAELTDEGNRRFKRMKALLRRNPYAVSGKYMKSLKQVKEWMKK